MMDDHPSQVCLSHCYKIKKNILGRESYVTKYANGCILFSRVHSTFHFQHGQVAWKENIFNDYFKEVKLRLK